MKTTIKIFLLALGTAVLASCGNDKIDDQAKELNIGYQNSPVSTLLMVADAQHYFDSTGVKVKLNSFTAGKFAITALVSGKGLDLALSGELPIPLAVSQGNKLNVITQVVKSTINECRIIAQKNGSAQSPEQFFSTKRKIATSLNGTPEFFLNAFIKAHNIDSAKIEIVGMKPEDMTSALLSKSVDAICIFDPVASIATQKIGSNGQVFQDSNIYSALYIISGLDKTVNTRKDDLVRFVKALDKAAGFVKSQPDSAKRIVSRYTKLDKGVLDALWKSYDFDIALTPKLEKYFTEETQWIMKKNGKTGAMPNYKDSVINISILKEAAPAKIYIK